MAKKLDTLNVPSTTPSKGAIVNFNPLYLPPFNSTDQYSVWCEKQDYRWDFVVGLVYLIACIVFVCNPKWSPTNVSLQAVITGVPALYYLLKSAKRYLRFNQTMKDKNDKHQSIS